MLKVSALLMLASLGVMGWLTSELGLLSFRSASASDKGTSVESSIGELQNKMSDRTKVLDNREAALTLREKALADKEGILKDQLDKYEKSVDGLKIKIKAME